MSIKEDRATKRERTYDKLENLKAERAELNDKLGMCSDEILHTESQLTLNADPQYRIEVTGNDVPHISYHVERSAAPCPDKWRKVDISEANLLKINLAINAYGDARKALDEIKVRDEHGDTYPVWVDIYQINRYISKVYVIDFDEMPF